jgi:hypothetical protein
MTRDEAIKIWGIPGEILRPEDIVDRLAALGAIKLDEPKNIKDRLQDLAHQNGVWIHYSAMERQLTAAGLKIVEA